MQLYKVLTDRHNQMEHGALDALPCPLSHSTCQGEVPFVPLHRQAVYILRFLLSLVTTATLVSCCNGLANITYLFGHPAYYEGNMV